jgi:hypothetical protein
MAVEADTSPVQLCLHLAAAASVHVALDCSGCCRLYSCLLRAGRPLLLHAGGARSSPLLLSQVVVFVQPMLSLCFLHHPGAAAAPAPEDSPPMSPAPCRRPLYATYILCVFVVETGM